MDSSDHLRNDIGEGTLQGIAERKDKYPGRRLLPSNSMCAPTFAFEMYSLAWRQASKADWTVTISYPFSVFFLENSSNLSQGFRKTSSRVLQDMRLPLAPLYKIVYSNQHQEMSCESTNRESGENPERSRHCKRECPQMPLGHNDPGRRGAQGTQARRPAHVFELCPRQMGSLKIR